MEKGLDPCEHLPGNARLMYLQEQALSPHSVKGLREIKEDADHFVLLLKCIFYFLCQECQLVFCVSVTSVACLNGSKDVVGLKGAISACGSESFSSAFLGS